MTDTLDDARPEDRRPAVEAVGLTKTYPGPVTALAGVDLTVRPGSIFALLGPNGAGKSTTVKILTTLARPDTGSAQVCGIDVVRRPEAVRSVIGLVGQKLAVDLEATGIENLVLQGRMHGLGGPALKRRAEDLLERFGLGEASRRVTSGWSGGMQRKLDVAMGLIHRPRVLFLDEPTTGLDPEARRELWSEISAAARDGLTVVLTTHYMEEADRLADRVAIMDRGRVVAEGSADELKAGLRGDAVVVELIDALPPGTDPAGLLHSMGALVGEVSLDARTLRARTDHGAQALPAVITALEAAGLGVASATLARPSLDDVYLRHAGRSFQAAESTHGKEAA